MPPELRQALRSFTSELTLSLVNISFALTHHQNIHGRAETGATLALYLLSGHSALYLSSVLPQSLMFALSSLLFTYYRFTHMDICLHMGIYV